MRARAARRISLVVDPVRCEARGLCAELFPERLSLDHWGYPIVTARAVPPSLLGHARRAVAACPKQALHLLEAER